jgi:hypothetical protein
MNGPENYQGANPPRKPDIDVTGKVDMTGRPQPYHAPSGDRGRSAASGTDPEAAGIDIKKRKELGSLDGNPPSPGRPNLTTRTRKPSHKPIAQLVQDLIPVTRHRY